MFLFSGKKIQVRSHIIDPIQILERNQIAMYKIEYRNISPVLNTSIHTGILLPILYQFILILIYSRQAS